MTAKIGISLPDDTYARAVAAARDNGTTVSGLVNEALQELLGRRAAVEHVVMLTEAEDPKRLGQRARARTTALAEWKRTG